MIETTSLLPPLTGPTANPLLFGVAAGLAVLFPPAETGARALRGEGKQDATASDADRPRTVASRREA